MAKVYQLKLDNFCSFLDEKLKLKYETEGLRGIRERLQALMNSLTDCLKMSVQLHDILAARYHISQQTGRFSIHLIKRFFQEQSPFFSTCSQHKQETSKLSDAEMETQKSQISQLGRALSVITQIVQVFNQILCEYTEPECLNLHYLQRFHASIQSRVELIYGNFQLLERLEVYREVIMQGGLFVDPVLTGSLTDNMNIELLKELDRLMRNVPNQLQEIEARAELCLPILKHVNDTQIQLKEPVMILQSKVDNLKALRQQLVDRGVKETIEAFVVKKCERDPPSLPNQIMPPTRHVKIFEELNQLVSYYKQFEFELLKALDTPIKLLQLFRISKPYVVQIETETGAKQNVVKLNFPTLSDVTITADEYEKILLFEQLIFGEQTQLTNGPEHDPQVALQQFNTYPYLSYAFNIFNEAFEHHSGDCCQNCGHHLDEKQKAAQEKPPLDQGRIDLECLILNVSLEELVEIVGCLDGQKGLIRLVRNYPLFRENVRPVQEFDVELVRECLSQAKKVLEKLNGIYQFDGYEAAAANNLSSEQLREVIDALKAQYGLLWESKGVYELYRQVKERTAIGWTKEFMLMSEVDPSRSLANLAHFGLFGFLGILFTWFYNLCFSEVVEAKAEDILKDNLLKGDPKKQKPHDGCKIKSWADCDPSKEKDGHVCSRVELWCEELEKSAE